MDLSLAAACLAKIPFDRIINFLNAEELKKWAKSVRLVFSEVGKPKLEIELGM
jgi:hypothetical protein